MRQKLILLFGLFILIAVLIGLNAAAYTQKETVRDSEMMPNRSTFNGGATGTRAYFDLLNETGHRPIRWIDQPSALRGPDSPSTLIMIGRFRPEIGESEVEDLLRWVEGGKRLVIIDRDPPEKLFAGNPYYEIRFEGYETPFLDTDAYDQSQMTIGTNAAKPSVPSTLTAGVNAIQSSRFARSIEFRIKDVDGLGSDSITIKQSVHEDDLESAPTTRLQGDRGTGLLPDQNDGNAENADLEEAPAIAPLVHFANDRKNIVVEVPHGAGRIVFVSDPYIVTNTGISIADNATFAINLAGAPGTVAFDEYHHGYGLNRNRFFEFFAGTPVIPIFLQIFLVIGLVFYSRSRRFARPVPEPEPNRLSKLEYVSAMAELQQRTKGYDIAIENIYGDFRRRVARLVGVDNRTTPRATVAMLIVERLPDENADEIEALMKRCEDVMHGDPSNRKEIVRLTARLREIERKLGLLRRKRREN